MAGLPLVGISPDPSLPPSDSRDYVSTGVALPAPPGVQAGDLLLIAAIGVAGGRYFVDGDGNAVPIEPMTDQDAIDARTLIDPGSGWTLLWRDSSPLDAGFGSAHAGLWWKIADGSDDATVTWGPRLRFQGTGFAWTGDRTFHYDTITGIGAGHAQMLAFRGSDLSAGPVAFNTDRASVGTVDLGEPDDPPGSWSHFTMGVGVGYRAGFAPWPGYSGADLLSQTVAWWPEFAGWSGGLGGNTSVAGGLEDVGAAGALRWRDLRWPAGATVSGSYDPAAHPEVSWSTNTVLGHDGGRAITACQFLLPNPRSVNPGWVQGTAMGPTARRGWQ
jgi:hypothetical protein